MDYKYNGIILSKIDIAEVDRIYNIYTREAGKIRVVGKGTRNPNAKLAGSLEPLTYSEIYISRAKGLGKITGAITLDNFSRLKTDYAYLEKVFFVFGILEKIITNEEKDEKTFLLLLGYLQILDGLEEKGKKEKIEIITLGFIFKLLHGAGYGLDMDNCVRCGGRLKPEDNFFSARSGGVICPKCVSFSEKRVKITSHSIKLIRIFLKNKISNFGKISVSESDIKNTTLIAGEMIGWVTG